jgi:hypothetical protein
MLARLALECCSLLDQKHTKKKKKRVPILIQPKPKIPAFIDPPQVFKNQIPDFLSGIERVQNPSIDQGTDPAFEVNFQTFVFYPVTSGPDEQLFFLRNVVIPAPGLLSIVAVGGGGGGGRGGSSAAVAGGGGGGGGSGNWEIRHISTSAVNAFRFLVGRGGASLTTGGATGGTTTVTSVGNTNFAIEALGGSGGSIGQDIVGNPSMGGTGGAGGNGSSGGGGGGGGTGATIGTPGLGGTATNTIFGVPGSSGSSSSGGSGGGFLRNVSGVPTGNGGMVDSKLGGGAGGGGGAGSLGGRGGTNTGSVDGKDGDLGGGGGGGGVQFGTSVLSGSGGTGGRGFVAFTVPTTDGSGDPLTLTSVFPTSGATGQTLVRLVGTNFFDITDVKFGALSTFFEVLDEENILALVPFGLSVGSLLISVFSGLTSVTIRFTVATNAVLSPVNPLVFGDRFALFSILAKDFIATTLPTFVTGNVGIFGGRNILGFPNNAFLSPATLELNSVIAGVALEQGNTLFSTQSRKTPTQFLSDGNLNGLRVVSQGNAVIRVSGNATLTQTLTLDFSSSASNSFVFQIVDTDSSTFTIGPGAQIVVANGGGNLSFSPGYNVFFVVNGNILVAENTNLIGNFLSRTGSITTRENLFLNGRLIALNNSISMREGIINLPVS